MKHLSCICALALACGLAWGAPPRFVNQRRELPILVGKQWSPAVEVAVMTPNEIPQYLRQLTFSLEGTSSLRHIDSLGLFVSKKPADFSLSKRFGAIQKASGKVTFRDELEFADTLYLWLAVRLKPDADIDGHFCAQCLSVKTNRGKAMRADTLSMHPLRYGMALRQHGQEQVHTFRIPGLTTTGKGTLVALYDVRRESARDLQGHIDIGISRSTDGGRTWEPTRIVLDMHRYGGLPEKFNGVSDACILADTLRGKLYVFGTWMHGVLSPDDGHWIAPLTEQSIQWNHQWRPFGSMPGLDLKHSAQFVCATSQDDGLTWSSPTNLTRMLKRPEWHLFAPSPGHGIVLHDGTLLVPTQGRDAEGVAFSNFIWSSDAGKSWHVASMAHQYANECMAVELDNGSLMLNMRYHGTPNADGTRRRAVAVTSNLGRTWTKHATSGCTLPEPVCMGSIHKHRYVDADGTSRTVLLFSNPNSVSERCRMTIKASTDNGESWPEQYHLLLDDFAGRGYSCITSIDSETIGILYEGSQADLVFQRISIKHLLHNK